MAFIAFGFLVARFSLFTRQLFAVAHIAVRGVAYTSTAFGVAMALVGLLTGVYGAYRYIVTERGMLAGADSPMPQWAALAGAAVTAVVAIVVVIALFLVR